MLMKKSQIQKVFILIVLPLFFFVCCSAQEQDTVQIRNTKADSIYILETEQKRELAKVLHAEPSYIDLIRDLGARKGEKEWNIGLGLTDNNDFDPYIALVEYEFAPVNRLGLEVELPFSFYYRNPKNANRNSIPRNRVNSIKLA